MLGERFPFTDFGFCEWWAGLSPWLRYGAAAVILLGSLILYYLDVIDGIRLAGCLAVGGVLLLFAGPSDSEKKGYDFWDARFVAPPPEGVVDHFIPFMASVIR